jgi:CDGSH-type Zn-finger protein/uncharacterized Fe-S cluster protein YjdI
MSPVFKKRSYQSENIVVHFDSKLCIHARECVRGLPSVFDTSQRRWVQPDQAPPELVAEVIQRCPTGALHFSRPNPVENEIPPEKNLIRIVKDGPLYISGNLTIPISEDQSHYSDTRMALCRCGASENKPFCDNSHLEINFRGQNSSAAQPDLAPPIETQSELEIQPYQNGPFGLKGPFEILSDQGNIFYRGQHASICRCGGSQNKPFCDNSHRRLGFVAEKW